MAEAPRAHSGIETPVHERGRGEFNPEALISALAPLAETEAGAAEPPAMATYRSFYALEFSERTPGVLHTMGWIESAGRRVVVQRFDHPRPLGTALVSHGYYDHVGLYGYLIEFLLGQRLSVVSFDQPGHGLSSGARATIGSFDEYVEVLDDVLRHHRPRLPAPWYIVGQSMGAAVAMEYVARQPESGFEEVVLLAPLIRPANWRLARFAYLAARYTIKERPRTITDNAENAEFMALMRRDPLAPMVLPVQWVTAMVRWMRTFEARDSLPFEPLVVQGHADETVDWRHNLKVLRQKTMPTVLEIPSARHHLVNESEAIRGEMFGWLAPRLGGRATGALKSSPPADT